LPSEIDSKENLQTLVALLRSLFQAYLPGDRLQFDGALHPALDAMCYDVCRIIRQEIRGDAVIMHPEVIEEICRRIQDSPPSLRTPKETEFVEAVQNFAVSLKEIIASSETPQGNKFLGKTFERIIKNLFRCVLLSGSRPRLKKLLDRLNATKYSSCQITSKSGMCPDVQDVKVFPRAFDSNATIPNVDCDQNVCQKLLQTACVCTPTHSHNVLLDIAVVADVVDGLRKRKLCLALQCKEYAAASSFKGEVIKWRNRDFHISNEEFKTTREIMSKFQSECDILWVLVTVSKPSIHLELRENEALLTLDHAIRWCPSLLYAKSASAVYCQKKNQVIEV
jgi:hypothetical protein